MDTHLYTWLRSFQQEYHWDMTSRMSAHGMADKYPACIQYTAQHVRRDMSQLDKELQTDTHRKNRIIYISGTFCKAYIQWSRDFSTISLSNDENHRCCCKNSKITKFAKLLLPIYLNSIFP